MIIKALLQVCLGQCLFLKKQREEDKRMKKKVLAFLLASTMVIEPFSMASAADFSDGMGQDTVQFSDDAEDVPEVENDDVNQFGTDVAGEDSTTSISFENVASGWISYNKLNVKGVINKDASYYITYVKKGENAPDYDENHKKTPTEAKYFSTTITVPQNPVDVYIFVADEQGNHISTNLTPNYDVRPVRYQMGDDVWVEFDDSTGTATISGKGDMWDYLEDGWDVKKEHENPLPNIRGIRKLVFSDEITSVSDLFLLNYNDTYMIESISFGKNIKRIGYRAFESCRNLTTITLPESLEEIGDQSFIGCGLISIVIPDSVKKAGTNCFTGCDNLKSVKISKNLLTIPAYMFSQCPRLENINMADSIKKIDDAAFKGCGVVNLQLPSGLEYIGYGAFARCMNLSQIMLPASIKYIDGEAFNGCKRLSTVTFEKGFSCDIGQDMFKNCDNLEAIEIPNGVKYIGSNSFANCKKLSEITIPSTVTSIYNNAFSGCDSLQTIKGYTGSYAETYAKNNGFTFESIGNAKETLQLRNAYCEWQGKEHSKINVRCTPNKDVCYYVTYVEKGSAAPDYDASKKDGTVRANNQIYTNVTDLPEEEVDIYVFVTDDDGNHISVRITPNYGNRPEKPLATTFPVKVGKNIVATLEGDTLTLTGSGATYDYDASWDDMDDSYVGNQWLDEETIVKIKKIVLGDGITQIGNFAFAGCTNLQEIVFPQKSLKKIKENVFYGCSSLKEFIVPEGVESLGDSSLYGCSSIEKISFPSTLKEIPCFSNDFEGLPKLRRVELAEGIEKIADGAFCHYKNLKTINLPSTIKEIGEYSFDYSGFVEITIPSNLKKVTRRAFEGDTNLKYVNLEDGVTIIEEDAFRDCTQLQYISIPESVTDIDALAFNGCPNFYIKVNKGSYAEKYANEYMIPFRTGSYKVIFKNNGRTVSTEYADKNESVTPPSLEEKPGYTLSWDADYTNIQEDMVINVVWTKKDNGGGNTTIIVSPSETNKYTVTFKDRGKIVKTEKVKSGDAAEYPYINRNGYELSWDKDFSKVTANITVNAVWTVIKPNKVTSLTAEVQKNSIDLSWDRAENTDYYLVYRKATSDTEYRQIKKTTKILWTDEDVEPGTEYSYKVVGVCSVDGKKYQGADSDIVTAKIGTPQIGDVYSVGNLKYKVTGAKEVSVTGLAKVTDTLTIPSSVTISGKVYKVTAIQDKAFYQNEDIVSIAIGNNVIYIGKYAFYQCPNLETVKFGKKVSVISTCAFTQCPNLENVTLPSSIRRIGAKAFYQCTSIKVLKINGSVLEYVGKKGLAVNKTVTLRLPKKVYTKYKKLIKASGVYSKTKFVKF